MSPISRHFFHHFYRFNTLNVRQFVKDITHLLESENSDESTTASFTVTLRSKKREFHETSLILNSQFYRATFPRM